jgi:hypothetical protein
MDLPRCYSFILPLTVASLLLTGCQATHSPATEKTEPITQQSENHSAPVAEDMGYDESGSTYQQPFIVPGKPDEIILSAVFNVHSWATGKDENTIIPIMRYAEGQYEGFNQYAFYEDSIDLNTSEVKPFFDRYKKYTLWLDGKPAGTLKVSALRSEMMACMKFAVGKSNDKISESKLKTMLKKIWIRRPAYGQQHHIHYAASYGESEKVEIG